MSDQDKEIIKKFFNRFSPTHAIVRANEAVLIKRVNLFPPVLDLGCGDGKFALLTFGKKKIDVGLDASAKEAEKARKNGAYKKVVVSNGSKMPFKNREFNTIISNSVLEHVADLELVLYECARVLSKNGQFIISVPTPLISDYFFWSKVIPGWANFKNKLWKHVNFFGEKTWQKKLEKAGFKIIKIEKTNSKPAIRWADIFFPLFLFGPIKQTLPFLEKKKAFEVNKNGATLVILAAKNE